MIKYQLVCDQNHEFEGWFQGSEAYDEQAANGLLRCPLCDSVQVRRALMTPNLASPKRRKSASAPPADQLPAAGSIASTSASSASVPSASPRIGHATNGHSGTPGVMQAKQLQAYTSALAELRQLRQKIINECRDVGDNFAEEARKIHYGDAEAEGIYGQTTHDERESLKDEGIEIFDMPWVPTDH